MEIFDQSGYGAYRYGNEFKNDNLSNIIGELKGDTREYLNHMQLLKMQDLFIDVYYISKEHNETGDVIYYFQVNDDPDRATISDCLSREDINDNVNYNPRMANMIVKRLMKNRLYYDNVATKQAVLDTVVKFS